jgi:preprotein translocase subunit Sec61beta
MGILYNTPPADAINQLERAGLVDHNEDIEQYEGYKLGRRVIASGIAAASLIVAAHTLNITQSISERFDRDRSVQTGPPSEELGRIVVQAAED